jgi:multidrug efflux pump subunit AcrA (membrane-fusion protein)
VEAHVNQADATQLRIGLPVHIGFDAYPDMKLEGRVHAVGAMARPIGSRSSYVVEVPIVIHMEETNDKVIPSLTVNAEVVVASEPATELIPREAVFYDAEDRRPYAYVRTPAGWERRALEIGFENHISAAVRSGVTAGEEVALEPPPEWHDAESEGVSASLR